jgi:hypothetical protein
MISRIVVQSGTLSPASVFLFAPPKEREEMIRSGFIGTTAAGAECSSRKKVIGQG